MNKAERYFMESPFWKRFLIVGFFIGCLGLIIGLVEGGYDLLGQIPDLFTF